MIRLLYAMGGLLGRGGTEAVVFNYLRYADKSRYAIDFLIPGEDPGDELTRSLRSDGHELFFVPPRGRDPAGFSRGVKALLESKDYDIVHSHMDASGGPVLAAAKRAGVPVRIAHSHSTGSFIPQTDLLRREAHKAVLKESVFELRRCANVFAACSQEAGEWLFGKKPFSVVPNGVELEKFAFDPAARSQLRSELGLEDKVILICVGRLSPEKNQTFLVDVMRLLDEKYVLLLVGDGSQRAELEEKTRELPGGGKTGEPPRVIFAGARPDVPRFLSAADVFVMPSVFEGLGIALIEAQANGLPCLASPGVPAEAVVADGAKRLGTLDAELWAQEIVRASAVPGRAPAPPGLERFDAKKSAAKMFDIYERALKENQ
ncbi:MAG: glycosyltransferase [Clostridiales bacterium]|nr:glycosyltransferase [Clostridiales bacterium]